MILKLKSTSMIVDVSVIEGEDGKLYGVYYDKATNAGKGGWLKKKISNFVPLDVTTEEEEHAKECFRDYTAEKVKEYKALFHLESEDVDDFKKLESNEDRNEWFRNSMSRLTRKDFVEIIKYLLEDNA